MTEEMEQSGEEVILDLKDVLEEYEDDGMGDNTSDEDMEGEEPMIIDATMAELELHDGDPSYSLSVSPKDPTLVASGGGNDKVTLFRIQDDPLQVEVVAELSGHTDTVEHVKFSFDGKLLATGGLDGTVRIWKVEDASLLHVLEGPTEVTWIDWHPKGDVLIAGSADGTVWMWNALLGQCMQVFSGGCPTSTCGLFSPDGKFLVTGGVGNITVWNPKDGTASITYTGNLPEVDALSIAIHPVMSVALVGFADGRLVVAHLGYHQILATHSTGEDAIEWVGYMKGHSIMMAATLGGSIHMIEAGNYRTRGVLSSEGIDGITSGTWLNKEGYLAVGCLNGTIAILDGRKGERMSLFPMGVEEDAVSENAVFDLVEIPHLDLLLASFDDGRVRIFRI